MQKNGVIWIMGVWGGIGVGQWIQYSGNAFDYHALVWFGVTTAVAVIVDVVVPDGYELGFHWPWQWKKP